MDSTRTGVGILANDGLTESEAASVDRVVQEMLGPDRKVVSIDKKVIVHEHEVIMVNGTPIVLEGEEGEAIKECLLRGSMPPQDLLNHLLLKAGLIVSGKSQTVKADMNVRTSVTTTENAALHKNGVVLDQRSRQVKTSNNVEGHVEEFWEPSSPSEMSPIANCGPHQNGMSPQMRSSSTPCNNSSHVKLVNGKWSGDGHSPGGMLSAHQASYSCRTTEISDAHVRNIKPSRSDFHNFGAFLPDDEHEDQVDFVRPSPDVSIIHRNDSDFSHLPLGGSSSRITPSPLKRLSGLTYDENGCVASGTLEELIHELVPRAHSAPTEDFQYAFLLSSRLFLTPTRLMAEVYRRADQLAYMLSTESHPTFVQNLVTMLSRWMVWFPMDFREESMQQKTRQLAQLAVERHPAVEARLSQLLHTLNTHLAAMLKQEKKVEKLSNERRETASTIDLLQLDIDSVEFSQELTRLELEYLCFLGPEEVVNAFARESSSQKDQIDDSNYGMDSDAHQARLRAAKKTKNLEAYVAWFNRLSFLVATTVCQKKKKKLRVRVIEFWIEIARECINLGNFNSLMGIITGLNMTPVSRLRRTWTKIQSAGKFAALEHQMDPSSNFLSYRSTLRAAVSRSEGATDQRQRIVVPFFSLLIKDLYFVNEGCASRLPNGHINFAKAMQLATRLHEFAEWKDVECPYQKNPIVAEFLQTFPVLEEDALSYESYDCELPDLPEEKERYKMFKHQFRTY